MNRAIIVVTVWGWTLLNVISRRPTSIRSTARTGKDTRPFVDAMILP